MIDEDGIMSEFFGRISPEKAGVSSRKVSEYIKHLKRRGVVFHSLMLLKGNDIFCEAYVKPFDEKFRHRMYSQTKSYVGIAIGLLLEEGKLSLEDKIIDHFPEKLSGEAGEFLKAQTVKDMLTMETGIKPVNWFKEKVFDRTKGYLASEDRGYGPGLLFCYDSAGSQVLSSLVEKLSGMSLLDYLKKKLFDKMGTFKTAEILKTPNGDSWGDSALVCTPRDMASFGRLLMQSGRFGGEQLISEDYVKTATSKVVDNNETGFEKYDAYGYGYQIWKTEQDGFSFNGMGCQFTICLPKKDLMLVITGDNQGHDAAKHFIFSGFFDYIADPAVEGELAEDSEGNRELEELCQSLELFAFEGMESTDFARTVDKKVFVCRENPMGIKEFSLEFGEGQGVFRYENAQGKKALSFGINKNVFCKFPQLGYSNDVGVLNSTDGFMYDCAVSGAWREERKFALKVQIIDRYFGNMYAVFSFDGKGNAVLKMVKTAEDFLDEYKGIAYASEK